MRNLKTEKGRKEAIEEIENSFINGLREIGLELHPNVRCFIQERRIELFIKLSNQVMFASSIDISAKASHNRFGNTENCINFGASGSINPSNKIPYWTIIHASELLRNWDSVCELVNGHCEQYSNLYNEIKSITP